MGLYYTELSFLYWSVKNVAWGRLRFRHTERTCCFGFAFQRNCSFFFIFFLRAGVTGIKNKQVAVCTVFESQRHQTQHSFGRKLLPGSVQKKKTSVSPTWQSWIYTYNSDMLSVSFFSFFFYKRIEGLCAAEGERWMIWNEILYDHG